MVTRQPVFTPNCPEQQAFILDDRPFVAYIAGRAAGKSTAGAIKLLRYLQRHPGARALVVAPIEEQLMEGAVPQLDLWLPPDIVNRPKQTPYLRYPFKNGCEVVFRSAKEPENLRGGNYAYVWFDEGAGCSERAFQLALATGRQAGYPPQIVITTTPQWRNWVYRVFVETSDPDQYAVYANVPSSVNAANLPPGYIEGLLERYGGPQSPFAQQEVFGRFVSQEGAVYHMFDRQKHLKAWPADIKWRAIAAGVDWGGRAPWALLVVGLDTEYRLWCLDEYYKAGILLSEFINVCVAMKKRWPITRFCCDGTNTQAVMALVRARLPAVAMHRHGNDWVRQGVMQVMNKFGQRPDGTYGLYIHPKLGNLVKEMEGYRRAEYHEGQAQTENPIKANDHLLDALRYVVEYLGDIQLAREQMIGKVIPFSMRMGTPGKELTELQRRLMSPRRATVTVEERY